MRVMRYKDEGKGEDEGIQVRMRVMRCKDEGKGEDEGIQVRMRVMRCKDEGKGYYKGKGEGGSTVHACSVHVITPYDDTARPLLVHICTQSIPYCMYTYSLP